MSYHKRRMKQKLKWLSVGIMLGAGAVMYFPDLQKLLERGRTAAEVIKVVDGDTFEIRYLERTEKVRLIGIDTPESSENAKAGKDAERSGQDVKKIVRQGNEAKKYVKALVPAGTGVRVETDAQERDKYGRLLVYLYLEDGRMINEEIVKAGYASPLTYPPNVRYKEKFLIAYRAARDERKGLWKQE